MNSERINLERNNLDKDQDKDQDQDYVQVLSGTSLKEEQVVLPEALPEALPEVSLEESTVEDTEVRGNTVNYMAMHPKRHRARWTNTEVAHLHREFRNKANSVTTIAIGHQRTHSAILYKLESEGLLDKEESEDEESDESEESEDEESETEEEEEWSEGDEEEDEEEEEDESEEEESEEEEDEEDEEEVDCTVDAKPLHNVFMYCKTAIGASYYYCRGFFFK
jgi:hypothetical protein